MKTQKMIKDRIVKLKNENRIAEQALINNLQKWNPITDSKLDSSKINLKRLNQVKSLFPIVKPLLKLYLGRKSGILSATNLGNIVKAFI